MREWQGSRIGEMQPVNAILPKQREAWGTYKRDL